MAPDVIAVLENADAARTVDAPTHDLLRRQWLLLGSDVTVDDLECWWAGEFEAADRRDVAETLVLPLVVVAGDPDIETALHLLESVEGVVREELLAHGLVQAFDLAGGG